MQAQLRAQAHRSKQPMGQVWYGRSREARPERADGIRGSQKSDLTQKLRDLKSVILGLPEPMRDVFLLNRMAGFSCPEIAERLGMEASGVQKLLAKALAELVRKTR